MNNYLLKIKNIGLGLVSILKKYPTKFLLSFILLLAIYALIIFGTYAIKTPAAKNNVSELEIKKELYSQVLQRLQSRDATIQQGIEQAYPDIFR